MNKEVSPFIELRSNKIPMHKGWSEGKNRVSIDFLESKDNIGFVPPVGYCIVDADTPEAVKNVERVNKLFKLEVFSYNTTRGKHFVYQMPTGNFFHDISSSNASSVFNTESAGSDIDVKAGGRNGKNGYVKIKGDGKWRVKPNDLIESLKSAPICPTILLIPKKLNIRISDYKVGSRDSTMFSWIPKLKSKGIDEDDFIKFAVEIAIVSGDEEDIHSTVEWAKQKWESSKSMGEVKDYFGEDLSTLGFTKNFNEAEEKAEIEDTFTYQKGTTLITGCEDYQALSNYIINKLKLIRSIDDNQIWGFVLGKMRPIGKDLDLHIKRFLIETFGNIKPAIMNDIRSYIEGSIPIKEFSNNEFIIKFQNRTIDTLTNKDAIIGENEMVQNTIPHNLIEHSALKTTHIEEVKFLYGLFQGWTKNNKQLMRQILERVGLTMIRYTGLEKIFFLLGVGANGKSLFLKMFRNMLGNENCSLEDLKQLSDTNGFSQSNLYGKLANINADISADVIEDPSTFKKLASGDPISAAYKGVDKFQFSPYAKMWFGTNNIPHLKEAGDSDGVNRRIEVIPFLAVFDKESKTEKEIVELKIKSQSEKVIEVMIRIAVDALHNALNSSFTVSQMSKDAFELHMKEMNHMYYYVEESGVIDNETIMDSYARYKNWIKQYGFKPYGQISYFKKYKNALRHKGIHINQTIIEGDKSKHRHKIVITHDENSLEPE